MRISKNKCKPHLFYIIAGSVFLNKHEILLNLWPALVYHTQYTYTGGVIKFDFCKKFYEKYNAIMRNIFGWSYIIF